MTRFSADRRGLRVLSALLLAAIVVPAFNTHPEPALHGRGLALLVALVALATALVWVLRVETAPLAASVLAVIVLAAAGAVIAGTQPKGAGELGLSLAAFVAGRRLEPRAAVGLVAALAVGTGVTMGLSGHSATNVAISLLLAALLLLMALLYRRLEEAVDREAEVAALGERSRIARELHDVLAHSLSGLALQLESARLMAQRDGVSSELQATLDRSRRLAEEGLGEARRAVGALRGDALPGVEDLGELVRAWADDHGVAAAYREEGAPRSVPAEAGLVLYRAAQEALTNVARHGRAQRADVLLRYEPRDTRLIVADHGPAGASGPLSDVGSGYGLTAMRERAEQLGGTVEAGPTEDGFRVEVALPA